MKKQSVLAIGLVVLASSAFASPKPVHIKTSAWSEAGLHKYCNVVGGSFAVEGDGKYSCVKNDTGISINCEKNGKCTDVCGNAKCGNDGKLTKNNNKVKPVTTSGGLANSGKGPIGGTVTPAGLNGDRSTQGNAHGNAAPGSPPIVATPSRQTPAIAGGAFGITSNPNTGLMTGPAAAAVRKLP